MSDKITVLTGNSIFLEKNDFEEDNLTLNVDKGTYTENKVDLEKRFVCEQKHSYYSCKPKESSYNSKLIDKNEKYGFNNMDLKILVNYNQEILKFSNQYRYLIDKSNQQPNFDLKKKNFNINDDIVVKFKIKYKEGNNHEYLQNTYFEDNNRYIILKAQITKIDGDEVYFKIKYLKTEKNKPKNYFTIIENKENIYRNPNDEELKWVENEVAAEKADAEEAMEELKEKELNEKVEEAKKLKAEAKTPKEIADAQQKLQKAQNDLISYYGYDGEEGDEGEEDEGEEYFEEEEEPPKDIKLEYLKLEDIKLKSINSMLILPYSNYLDDDKSEQDLLPVFQFCEYDEDGYYYLPLIMKVKSKIKYYYYIYDSGTLEDGEIGYKTYKITKQNILEEIDKFLSIKKYIEFLNYYYNYQMEDKSNQIYQYNPNKNITIKDDLIIQFNTQTKINFYQNIIQIEYGNNLKIYISSSDYIFQDDNNYEFIIEMKYKDNKVHNDNLYMFYIMQTIYFSSNYTIPPKQTQNCRGHSGGFRRKSLRKSRKSKSRKNKVRKSRRKSKSPKSKARKSRKTKKSRKSRKSRKPRRR